MQARNQVISAPKPLILHEQLNLIEKEIAEISEQALRIESAVGRLINPTPSAVGSAQAPTPQQSTAEGRMQDLVRQLKRLSESLHYTADRFDSAI